MITNTSTFQYSFLLGAHIYKLLSLVIMLVVGDFMMVVSVVLWVAVGFQVGLQDSELSMCLVFLLYA